MLTVGVVALAANGDAETTGVDLSGTWVLNADLSDSPLKVIQEKMEEMRGRGGKGTPQGPPPGGGRGGGWPGGGAPGGHGGEGDGFSGSPRGGEEMQKMQARLEQTRPPYKIVITQNDDSITMMPAGLDTLAFVPDGEKRKHKTSRGEIEIKAKWENLALVLETKGPEGNQIQRLYRINDDGRLEIVTELELPRGGEKVEIVRRYDDVSQ